VPGEFPDGSTAVMPRLDFLDAPLPRHQVQISDEAAVQLISGRLLPESAAGFLTMSPANAGAEVHGITSVCDVKDIQGACRIH
jgi:hypothetical protein